MCKERCNRDGIEIVTRSVDHVTGGPVFTKDVLYLLSHQSSDKVANTDEYMQKNRLYQSKVCFLELLTGFEPVTPSLPRTCSTY